MPFYKGFHYVGRMQYRNYGHWKKTYGKYIAVVNIGTAKHTVWCSGWDYDSKQAAEQAAEDKIDSGNLDKFKK